MTERRDYIALEWLSGEIGESLEACRNNLLRYRNDPTTELSDALQLLHQVQGSLRMVEFSGAALLAEEMEQSLDEIVTARLPASRTAELLDALVILCAALPDYFAELVEIKEELPVRLIGMFNELRAARGQVMLSSTVLFAPALDVPPATPVVSAIDSEDFLALADKLRRMYQLALDNYLKNVEPDKSLGYLAKVCARAAKLTAGSERQNFWLASSAFTTLLVEGELHSTPATRAILRRIDREIRRLSESGVQGKTSQSLYSDLLFYVALSESSEGLVDEVKQRHRIAAHFQQAKGQWRDIYGPAVASIIQELRRHAGQLKSDASSLEVRAHCKELRDVMAVLGLIRGLYSINAATDMLKDKLSDGQALAVAKSFLSLADELEGQTADAGAQAEVDDVADPARQRELVSLSNETLNEAQDAVMAYVAEGWKVDLLLAVPARLHELASKLEELGLPAPAQILTNCARFVVEQLIEQGKQPSWQELDALADALMSVDYYLERSVHGPQHEDTELLRLAESCLNVIGYPVSSPAPAPAVADVDATVVPVASEIEVAPAPSVAENAAVAALELDPEILEIFLEEAGEVLDLLRERLPRWRQALLSRDMLAEVRRAFHTLKGSGRMAGAQQCGELGWAVENMLNKVVEERLDIDDARLTLVEKATELLPELIDGLRDGYELPLAQLQPILDAAEALSREQSPELGEILVAMPQEQTADEGLIGVFIGEADVHLGVIENYLDNVVSYPVRLSDEVQRSLHTLKGSSKMAEVWAIANIVTPLEGLVKELRAMRIPADEALISLIAAVVVETRRLITRLHHSAPSELAVPEELRQRIETLAEQMLHEASAGTGMRAAGQIDPGELQQFLMVYGDHLQNLMDAIDRSGGIPSSSLFRNYGSTMGQFAIRAEEIGSESTAEMAQALQVMFTRTRDPLSESYVALVRQSLDQLMEDLNQLAAEQTASENAPLLDKIRDFDSQDDELAALPDDVAEMVREVEREAATPLLDEDVDPEILEIFMEEANDLLESLDEAIHQWSDDRGNTAHIDDILRYLHTLKGGARLSGMSALGDMAHDFETLLATAVAKDDVRSDALFAETLAYQDKLVRFVDAVAAGGDAGNAAPEPEPVSDTEPPVPEVAALAETPVDLAPVQVRDSLPAPEQGELAPQLAPTPAADIAAEANAVSGDFIAASLVANRGPQEMIKVPAGLLERLINLAGESSIARGRVEEQVNDVHYSLEEMEMTVSRLQEQVRRLDMETEAQIIFRQEQMESEGAEGFDPLEFDRYSQLQQLSRALLESASDLIDLRSTVVDKNRDIETLLAQQSRVNTELQEGLMHSQMVHFSRMVPRLRRGVRQVAGELGKKVEFKVYNADGEMDRRVLERIIPALEHVLRNAIDHGIEDEQTRLAQGKPAAGQISMHFDRQGGDVVMLIGDDGGGINLEAVRKKAESLGLVSADATLSDAQLLEYIFHAGFSTASNVTQISGRGVGMDAVRNEIKQLGGAITVKTDAGAGTRFEIRLPFTVSVNRALMVSVGGEIYAVPLNNIEGIVRVSPYELEVYYEPGGPDYEYAGQTYRLRYMGQLVGGGNPILEGQVEPRPVLLIRNAEPAAAVQVDSLLGSREVVVKTLGPQFATVPGLSGATVLGDGSVVVILDMLAAIRANEARLLLGDAAGEQARLEQDQDVRRVMVIDDSVTVRKVTARLLERQKMSVVLARDGLEAVQLLQEMTNLPDVMLLDIEMPRMDGFEVASRVRSNPRLKHIPIIMISSRTGQKHRQRAQGLGVNRFLGKPYQEIQLLKAIDEVIASVGIA
jgi:chemosensory pili system protein ChpA (sensor histidine kinase/response regulator)